MRRAIALLAALPLAFALGLGSACGSTGTGGDGDGDGDTDRTTYPEGPYGTGEGDIIENEMFSLASGEDFSFDDIYSDPANKLLLLSTAAGWCTACREEQPALQALQDEHGADGLYVLVTLFEDNNSQPADADEVTQWIEQYDLSIQVVVDADFVMDDYYDSALTPMNMFVDLDTMEIVRITTGWDPAVADAIIADRL